MAIKQISLSNREKQCDTCYEPPFSYATNPTAINSLNKNAYWRLLVTYWHGMAWVVATNM